MAQPPEPLSSALFDAKAGKALVEAEREEHL